MYENHGSCQKPSVEDGMYFVLVRLFFFNLLIYYYFLAALGLCFFAPWREGGLGEATFTLRLRGLLIAVASLVAEHGL